MRLRAVPPSSDERFTLLSSDMTQPNFLPRVGTLIVALIVLLLIDEYRACKERGYSDCQRQGRLIYPDHKKLPQ
jgi:hypothetical protein